MFPPKKSGPGAPPAQKQAPSGPGNPAPGMDLISLLGGAGSPGGLGGMPMPGMGGPMGGGLPPVFGGGPGMPPPGRGMHAMSAMQGGLGMAQPPAPVGVNGPNGLPVGGVDPGQGSPDQFGGSDLLSMLSQPGGGIPPGDQYDQPPGVPSLEDAGDSDPDSGMDSLLSMLAIASMGVDPSQASGGMSPGMGGGMWGGGMPC